jgi:hypothetical protein
MKCTIGLTERQWRWGMTAHRMAVLSLVALTVMGVCLESVEGWEAMGRAGNRMGGSAKGQEQVSLGHVRMESGRVLAAAELGGSSAT